MLMINNTQYRIDIQDKYCLFGGDSGSGKTLMVEFIKAHCVATGIQCNCVDYSFSRDSIIATISNVKYDTSILIIDNADIVMCSEI